MARFRIVQRPRVTNPALARFDVQERVWWWWESIDFAWTIEEAEALLFKIKNGRENTIETKVIKKYN